MARVLYRKLGVMWCLLIMKDLDLTEEQSHNLQNGTVQRRMRCAL